MFIWKLRTSSSIYILALTSNPGVCFRGALIATNFTQKSGVLWKAGKLRFGFAASTLSRVSSKKRLDLDSACLLTTRITSTAKFWALSRPRRKQHKIANNTSFQKKTLVYHLLGGRFLCLWECGEITGLAGAITSKSTTLIVSQWLTRYATIAHRYTCICNKPTLWQVSATPENKLGYFC